MQFESHALGQRSLQLQLKSQSDYREATRNITRLQMKAQEGHRQLGLRLRHFQQNERWEINRLFTKQNSTPDELSRTMDMIETEMDQIAYKCGKTLFVVTQLADTIDGRTRNFVMIYIQIPRPLLDPTLSAYNRVRRANPSTETDTKVMVRFAIPLCCQM